MPARIRSVSVNEDWDWSSWYFHKSSMTNPLKPICAEWCPELPFANLPSQNKASSDGKANNLNLLPKAHCLRTEVSTLCCCLSLHSHYSDVIMGAMASQITFLTIVYSTVYSGADQRKNQSSASLAFVRGIHRWPVNSPHKGPVTRKMFPTDGVIMFLISVVILHIYAHNQWQHLMLW